MTKKWLAVLVTVVALHGTAMALECEDICNPSMSCAKRCSMDGELITCGLFGTCNAPYNCQYVQTTPLNLCLVENDDHIWGTTVEAHGEAWFEDVNHHPSCTPHWETRILASHNCYGVFNEFECCLGTLGPAVCYPYWIPGTCH